MSDRQTLLRDFLAQLLDLERKLDALDDFSTALATACDGHAFAGQQKLAVALENLVTTATHETASTLGFYRGDIERMVNLIALRERYPEFSADELAEILDGHPTPAFKQHLLPRFNNAPALLARLDTLRRDWNATFNNQSWHQITRQLDRHLHPTP
jgi:hypothetical protein